MFEHKHTSVAIVLTVFALTLAMSSMAFPYYKVVDGSVDDDGRVRYYTVEFYSSYYHSSIGMGDYSSSWYGEVGALFNLMWVLLWVWALGAMFYILKVLHVDETEFRWWQGGFIAGCVLAVVALLPALVFALLIDSSYAAGISDYTSVSGFIGSTTHDEWGPMSGWMLLALACMVQVVAVLARNVPAILHMLNMKGPEEVPPEVAARGDLPIR